MVIVYTKGRDGRLAELFCSEVVSNSVNPKWIKQLTIDYQFEVVQTLLAVLSHTRSKREGKEGVKVDRVGEAFVVEINCPYGRNNRTPFSCRDCYSCGKQLDIHIL